MRDQCNGVRVSSPLRLNEDFLLFVSSSNAVVVAAAAGSYRCAGGSRRREKRFGREGGRDASGGFT